MPTKRQIVTSLSRPDLQKLAAEFDIEVKDRRVKRQLIAALARTRRVNSTQYLQCLPVATLRELCETLELGAGPRTKAKLIDFIAGTTSAEPPSTKPARKNAKGAITTAGKGVATQSPSRTKRGQEHTQATAQPKPSRKKSPTPKKPPPPQKTLSTRPTAGGMTTAAEAAKEDAPPNTAIADGVPTPSVPTPATAHAVEHNNGETAGVLAASSETPPAPTREVKTRNAAARESASAPKPSRPPRARRHPRGNPSEARHDAKPTPRPTPAMRVVVKRTATGFFAAAIRETTDPRRRW